MILPMSLTIDFAYDFAYDSQAPLSLALVPLRHGVGLGDQSRATSPWCLGSTMLVMHDVLAVLVWERSLVARGVRGSGSVTRGC